jgi:hypothetical protein
MCLPKTPHRRNRRKSFTKLNLATPSQMQLKLHEYYATYAHGEERYEQYIEPAGDPLVAKQDDYMRVILCNINGFRLQEGFQTAPAIAAIGAFQADVACYTEINTNATTSFHDQVKHQLDAHLGPSQVTTASGAATKDGYLPGGVMQAIVGHHNGRVRQRAADRWGRFTWATMRGSRDEGIVIITAYRVCQRKGTKTTSRTAYQQQVKEMVREEYGIWIHAITF